jgi:hypothetical protein
MESLTTRSCRRRCGQRFWNHESSDALMLKKKSATSRRSRRQNLAQGGASGTLGHVSINSSGVCRKKDFLRVNSVTLCVSVVKLLSKTFTTEAQRLHRGPQSLFFDRLLQRVANETLTIPRLDVSNTTSPVNESPTKVGTLNSVLKSRAVRSPSRDGSNPLTGVRIKSLLRRVII